MRDEYRPDYDPDRGGFGRKVEEAHLALYEMMSSSAPPVRPEVDSLPPPEVTSPLAAAEEKETPAPDPVPADIKMETD